MPESIEVREDTIDGDSRRYESTHTHDDNLRVKNSCAASLPVALTGAVYLLDIGDGCWLGGATHEPSNDPQQLQQPNLDEAARHLMPALLSLFPPLDMAGPPVRIQPITCKQHARTRP